MEWIGWIVGAVLSLASWLLARRSLETARAETAAANARLGDALVQTGKVPPLEDRARELALELERERVAQVRLSSELARVQTELRMREQQLGEQHRTLEEARLTLVDTFKALGSEALAVNNERFLQLAEQRLNQTTQEQRKDGDQRREAIDAMLDPIQKLLEDQRKAVHDLEKQRISAYAGLVEKVQQVSIAHDKLTLETGKLAGALTRSDVRGRWGELQLRRVVELAGMLERCDFDTQVQLQGDAGVQRPDMIVHLPGKGCIVVDAKAPLSAYLEMGEQGADRKACLERHAQAVRGHVRALGNKAYWKQFTRTPELVVMFLPMESALTAALEADHSLHSEALEQHVLLVTPTLLLALLHSVAYGWRQEAAAENVQKVTKLGKELHERVATFLEHYSKLGKSLKQAVEAYNKATGSLEDRLLVSARKLGELETSARKSLSPPSTIDMGMQLLSSESESETVSITHGRERADAEGV
jgi:DNA recombination protein RmuC